MRIVQAGGWFPDPAQHSVEPEMVARAVAEVADYQQRFERDPGRARVSLAGVPHALIPTAIVARDLPSALAKRDDSQAVALVLHELGVLIGRTHATAFFEDRGIDEDDRLHRVLTGPAHFAWAGFGDVNLLLMDTSWDVGFAALWESVSSFSAADAGSRVRSCHLQVGYASGWLSEATGQTLHGTEIACRAEGAHRCRFVIGHESRIHALAQDPRMHKDRDRYDVLPIHAVRAD
ncbi:hypothetical protein DSM112329_04269 [Paraconexibacter sp. AEG42_29]|uniref:4-vinyl reductase 4VR domain-containing protein n=1 Tax=Paraconexibacter sp. AEG42_29 TaxID=2997339 RepID=A0AAU7B0B1_9ACTN